VFEDGLKKNMKFKLCIIIFYSIIFHYFIFYFFFLSLKKVYSLSPFNNSIIKYKV
jgi:hypothetical protein